MNTITIPKNLIQKDDLVIISRKEYEKARRILNIISENQIWFWTKEWQNKEREADNNMKMGKISGPFYSGKELLKSLKSKK